MKFKRVTLFAGHYGSGKTNIAVNYAKKIKEETRRKIGLPVYKLGEQTVIWVVLRSKYIQSV